MRLLSLSVVAVVPLDCIAVVVVVVITLLAIVDNKRDSSTANDAKETSGTSVVRDVSYSHVLACFVFVVVYAFCLLAARTPTR